MLDWAPLGKRSEPRVVETDSSFLGGSAREDARALHNEALVCDTTLPLQPRYGDFALLDARLPRRMSFEIRANWAKCSTEVVL